MTLAGAPVLDRIEKVNFTWTGVAGNQASTQDQFSVRWTGFVEADGQRQLPVPTRSNDGVRLWINGTLVDRQLDGTRDGRGQHDGCNRPRRRTSVMR